VLHALERPAAGEAAGALVLLHGRGADEHDLFPLLDALDPDRRLHGYTPRGPLALPPGGAHWYALGGIPTPPAELFHASLDALSELVDGLPYERVVIGGFSQGCVMSYALALGRGRPRPAALLALSGFLPQVEGFELDLESAFPPIVVAHGTYDPVIPVDFGREARDTLNAAGAEVEYRESPIEHWIDPQVIPLLRSVVADATTR
jgi:phospholipase/carboxylesterase